MFTADIYTETGQSVKQSETALDTKHEKRTGSITFDFGFL